MGKVFAVEATAPDARYPKLWDDPEIQGAIAATRAVVVPAQYVNRMGTIADNEKDNCTRRTWLLLSRELLPWGAALWADHESVAVATAEHYRLRVLKVFEAAYQGGPAASHPPP